MHNLHPGAYLLPGAKLHPGVNLHPLCSVHMSVNCVHMLLDLLFKHITNVSVLHLGDIRCIKNVSIIIQFKIPSCEKNATPFGFICFIHLYNI